MADLDGSVYPLETPSSGPYPASFVSGSYYGMASHSFVINYTMRGINISSNYVYWNVTGSPDLTGAQAPEAIPDPSTIVIAAQWVP